MWLELRAQQVTDGVSYRICEETTGKPAERWLPWEDEEPKPLDGGGFEDWADAEGFRLAIMLVRAEAGLLSDMTPRDVEAARNELDVTKRGRPTAGSRPVVPLLEVA